MPTTLTINYIPNTYYTNKATITGKLSTKNNNLYSRPITLNINGKTITRYTNDNGIYKYQYKTNKVGTNNITATYIGNNYYQKSTAKKTFKVTKMPTTLTMNTISTTYKGNYVEISGYFTNNENHVLKNTDIILNINGKEYYTKTDDSGDYYYSYKTTKTGTNKVTAIFKGNSKYVSSSISKTFNVKNRYNTIEIYTHLLTGPYPKDSKRVGDDIFESWYQLRDAQSDKGVHLTVTDYYAEDMGDAPNNLIIDATFYFKNSAGNIISKKFEKGYGDSMYHSLVSGYTPYKIVASYRKMTDNERYMWYQGYGYNPKTGKWYSY